MAVARQSLGSAMYLPGPQLLPECSYCQYQYSLHVVVEAFMLNGYSKG